jgi:hypothetical protein
MPLVSDIVRSALASDMSPEEIVLLSRRPVEVRARLEAAYSEDPPEYTLPRKGMKSRPWVVYGRENAGSSVSRAPTWRATAALQTLIYSHEVAIEDPVAWYRIMSTRNLATPGAPSSFSRRSRNLLRLSTKA